MERFLVPRGDLHALRHGTHLPPAIIRCVLYVNYISHVKRFPVPRVPDDTVQQILLKCAALLCSKVPVRHDDKRDDKAAALKRELHVPVRLCPQTVSLVKMLAAAGNLILRRFDLQNQRLVLRQQLPENRAASPVAAQRRLNSKMLKIAEVLCLPQNTSASSFPSSTAPSGKKSASCKARRWSSRVRRSLGGKLAS